MSQPPLQTHHHSGRLQKPHSTQQSSSANAMTAPAAAIHPQAADLLQRLKHQLHGAHFSALAKHGGHKPPPSVTSQI